LRPFEEGACVRDGQNIWMHKIGFVQINKINSRCGNFCGRGWTRTSIANEATVVLQHPTKLGGASLPPQSHHQNQSER
jgi:hypothetical protein